MGAEIQTTVSHLGFGFLSKALNQCRAGPKAVFDRRGSIKSKSVTKKSEKGISGVKTENRIILMSVNFTEELATLYMFRKTIQELKKVQDEAG